MTEMGTSIACRSSVCTQTIFAVSCLVVVMGCDLSDGVTKSREKHRTQSCQEAGATGGELKACTSTDEGYERIMGPIRAQREREQVDAFNAALRALPSRSIPKDRYETVSLEVLKKNKCCLLDYTNAIEAPKHPLFGKRFVVQGSIVYFPTDLEEKREEHQWLELRDATNQKDTWQLEADLGSLSREERALIRANCAFNHCTGEFLGVIGRIEKAGELEAHGLQSRGLQIEYMELSPRELKKTS